jgi:hypothetical protein
MEKIVWGLMVCLIVVGIFIEIFYIPKNNDLNNLIVRLLIVFLLLSGIFLVFLTYRVYSPSLMVV